MQRNFEEILKYFKELNKQNSWFSVKGKSASNDHLKLTQSAFR